MSADIMHAGDTEAEHPGTFWVIVVSYNAASLLDRCLRCVLASCLDRRLAVYVVDNGSTDESLRVAQAYSTDERVRVRALGSNSGFAKANNVALREILTEGNPATDLVLLLNNDCFVAQQTLRGIEQFFDTHPDVGVVGPKLLLPDGGLDLACRRAFPTPESALWKFLGLARRFPQHPRFGRYNLTYTDPDATQDVDAVSGACMAVRLATIAAVGLLDESFFMYGEDLDWAYRIKQAGWRIVYYPAVQAVHVKGGSGGRRTPQSVQAFYHAMGLFYRKHYTSRYPWWVNVGTLTGITVLGTVAYLRALCRTAWSRSSSLDSTTLEFSQETKRRLSPRVRGE